MGGKPDDRHARAGWNGRPDRTEHHEPTRPHRPDDAPGIPRTRIIHGCQRRDRRVRAPERRYSTEGEYPALTCTSQIPPIADVRWVLQGKVLRV
jgi:hypothetical protein